MTSGITQQVSRHAYHWFSSHSIALNASVLGLDSAPARRCEYCVAREAGLGDGGLSDRRSRRVRLCFTRTSRAGLCSAPFGYSLLDSNLLRGLETSMTICRVAEKAAIRPLNSDVKTPMDASASVLRTIRCAIADTCTGLGPKATRRTISVGRHRRSRERTDSYVRDVCGVATSSGRHRQAPRRTSGALQPGAV
ncbi:hypothetical protein LMG28138_06061 [Pararobbsia alpina]|uniref:Uncharacterized protein n=1 Tax=Pararobbsia alpina TaxID=621374 RepID=A0A6S7BPI8_9BURK|nr:hypothetical protein LMG28138_06061 [Pararobbsia alpina]